MRILIGDKDHVDFDSPVKMTEKQMDKFIDFMKSIFSVVKKEPCDKFRTDRIGDKLFFCEWDPDELKLLWEIKDNDHLCQDLGRTWMSVDIKRGDFYQPFMKWINEAGHDLAKEDVKKLIEEFLKEQEIEKLIRKDKRQNIKKQIKNLNKKLNANKEKLKRQKWFKKLSKDDPDEIDRAISETESEIKKIWLDIAKSCAGCNISAQKIQQEKNTNQTRCNIKSAGCRP